MYLNGESRGRYFDVVGIEGHIGELIMSAGVGFGVAAIAADGIFDGDGGAGDDCPAHVGDGTGDGSGVTC